MRYVPLTLTAHDRCGLLARVLSAPAAQADGDNNTLRPNNHRLNNGVVANVYTVQQQAGCNNDVKINPQLQLAAQWHTDDVMNNRNLDGDLGSDGSSPQDRANAAGYHGQVAETVAINPALAISGIELINQWYDNPAYKAIMSNCANSQMGVWSENSPDRTVVVAVYGQPPRHRQCRPTKRGGSTSLRAPGEQHPARSQPRLRRQRRARIRRQLVRRGSCEALPTAPHSAARGKRKTAVGTRLTRDRQVNVVIDAVARFLVGIASSTKVRHQPVQTRMA